MNETIELRILIATEKLDKTGFRITDEHVSYCKSQRGCKTAITKFINKNYFENDVIDIKLNGEGLRFQFVTIRVKNPLDF